MKTRAPEFRALIIIFGSAGPVISTRRSSRSAGAGATATPRRGSRPSRAAGRVGDQPRMRHAAAPGRPAVRGAAARMRAGVPRGRRAPPAPRSRPRLLRRTVRSRCSPAASLPDESMEDARRHRASIVCRGTDVVDRRQLVGQRQRSPIRRFGCRSGTLEDPLRGRRPDGRRCDRAKPESNVAPHPRPGGRGDVRLVAPGKAHDDLADRLGPPRADLSGNAPRGRASGIRIRSTSSSGARAVVRYAGQKEAAGTTRSPRGPPTAMVAPSASRTGQRVAGRRGVGDVPAERAAVLDLGRTDGRGRFDERRQVLTAERRSADLRVGRQRPEHERARAGRVRRPAGRRSRGARRAATGRGGGRAAGRSRR